MAGAGRGRVEDGQVEAFVGHGGELGTEAFELTVADELGQVGVAGLGAEGGPTGVEVELDEVEVAGPGECGRSGGAFEETTPDVVGR